MVVIQEVILNIIMFCLWGLLPIIITNRNVASEWKRFLFIMLVGVCCLLAGELLQVVNIDLNRK